jgi:hypothetical protein
LAVFRLGYTCAELGPVFSRLAGGQDGMAGSRGLFRDGFARDFGVTAMVCLITC